MSLPNTAQVLVVGGGPTGLCLALALQKHGCPDVVVVDSVLAGENTSRAITLHAATVEALDSIGCADRLVAEGAKINSTTVWQRSTTTETAYFPPLARYTKFPYILVVPQHVTEMILQTTAIEHGVQVHRPHKVVDMKPNTDDPQFTDVTFEDGHVLHARCVVGADGARSTVRTLANVGWADPTGQANVNDPLAKMILADIALKNAPSFPADAINLLVSPTNAMLYVTLPGTPYPAAPLSPGESVVRIACGIPPELGTPPSSPDTLYLQKLIDRWGPNEVLPADAPRVEITRTLWSSRFRTHSAIADRLFTHVPSPAVGVPEVEEGGPVCLIGDAAHIHPPMGGQGMNLGIRDGVRLAPVLAEYVRAAQANDGSKTREELEAPLRAWAEERRSRALTVIGLVKRISALLAIPNERRWVLGFIPYNPGWLRDVFLGFMTRFEWFKANSAWQVSGLGNP